MEISDFKKIGLDMRGTMQIGLLLCSCNVFGQTFLNPP